MSNTRVTFACDSWQCLSQSPIPALTVVFSPADAFDFDFEEQELLEAAVRRKVLEEIQFYSSSAAMEKAAK